MTSTRKRSQPQPQQEKRQIPWLGIIFGIIAVALVGAIAFTGGDSTAGDAEAADVSIDGELPRFQATVGDPAIGMPAPNVTGENFDGDSVSISNDGTPKAIAFLAHWCPHCQAEVPRVQEWIDGGGGVAGVEIYSVATSENELGVNHPASQWLEDEGWTAPVISDDANGSTHLAFGGGGFPYWVFVNADGTVAARTAGELDIGTLEQLLQQIATG